MTGTVLGHCSRCPRQARFSMAGTLGCQRALGVPFLAVPSVPPSGLGPVVSSPSLSNERAESFGPEEAMTVRYFHPFCRLRRTRPEYV